MHMIKYSSTGLPGNMKKWDKHKLPPESVLINGTRMDYLGLIPEISFQSASNWPWACILWRGPLVMGSYQSEYVGVMPKGVIVIFLSFSGKREESHRYMVQLAAEHMEKKPLPRLREETHGIPISIRKPAEPDFRFFGEMRLGSTGGVGDGVRSVSLTGFCEMDMHMYPDQHLLPSVRAKFTPEQLSGEKRPRSHLGRKEPNMVKKINHQKVIKLEEDEKYRKTALDRALERYQHASYSQREDFAASLGYAATQYARALRALRLELEKAKNG